MIQKIQFEDGKLDAASIEFILLHSETEIFDLVSKECGNRLKGQTAVFEIMQYFDAAYLVENLRTREALQTKLAWSVFLAVKNSHLYHEFIRSSTSDPYKLPRAQLLGNLDSHMEEADPDLLREVKLGREICFKSTFENDANGLLAMQRLLSALHQLWCDGRHNFLSDVKLTNLLEIEFKKFCGNFPQIHRIHSHLTLESRVVVRPSIFLGDVLDFDINGGGDPYDYFLFPNEPELPCMVWNSNHSFFMLDRYSDELRVFIAMLDWNNNPGRFLKTINEGRGQRMNNSKLAEIVEHFTRPGLYRILPKIPDIHGAGIRETAPFSKMSDTDHPIIVPKSSYSYDRGIMISRQEVGDSDCYFFNRKESSSYGKQIRYLAVLDEDASQLDECERIYS